MLVYMLQGENAGNVLLVANSDATKGIADGWAVDLTNKPYPWDLPLVKSPFAPLPQSYLDWVAAGRPWGDYSPVVIYRTQQIASRSEQNIAVSGALTAANQKSGGRARFYFSHDCDKIQVGFNGYYIVDAGAGNSNQCIETPLANTYDMRCAVEYLGQSKILAWNGAGLRTILAGEDLALSDQLLASAFGVQKFTKGDEFWLRMERVTPVGGNMLYHYANVNSPAITGERFFTAATTATDVLPGTGDWPATGGWAPQSVVWLPCCIIGEISGKKQSDIVLGASIEHGANESGRGDGVNGAGGYIRRGYAVKKGARISIMKPTESAKSFVANSAKRRKLFPYATHAYTAHGGNDYSYGYSAAATETAYDQIWALCRAASHKITHIGLAVKTDSTNGWIDEANQTPRAGFEIGGAWRDAVNNYAKAKVGSSVDRYFDLDASQTGLAVGGSRVKWRTDGGAASIDGTHPGDYIHAAMGAQFATEIETDRLAFEGA